MRHATALAVSILKLVWSIASHFLPTHYLCVPRSRISQKNTKTHHFEGFQLFKVINADTIKSSSPVLVMISSMSVPICNRFHATRANIGKLTTFCWGTLL